MKAQADGTALFAGEAWFDPVEAGIRERVRGFVEPRGSPARSSACGRDFPSARCPAGWLSGKPCGFPQAGSWTA